MEVLDTAIKVASMTETAISQGFTSFSGISTANERDIR
jgi:hypothetical protein